MANISTVRKFLREHHLGVLGTVTQDGTPISTPIFHILTDDDKIRFVTKNKTTKFENLIKNNRVAISVMDFKLPLAVNLTGVAKQIEDSGEIKETFRRIGKIQMGQFMPPVIKHRKGDFVVFEITPQKIQYTDYTMPMSSKKYDINSEA